MHWITGLDERGFACITIQNNCYRDQDICKISRNTAAWGKQIKLDSDELAVSSCTYLAVVRDIEVISYRRVFCCQRVNLYGGRRAQTVSLPVQDFSHTVPPPLFFFPPHLPFLISVLLFFPPRDLIWTVICWQRSRCLACSLVNRTLCSLPSLSKLQIQLHIYLVEQFHSPGAFPRQPFLPLPSSSVNHLLQVTYMVTSLSMPPTTAEVPWMNSWNISNMEYWPGNSIKAVLAGIFTCYHLKIFPIFKYFRESPLAVQMLVNNEECDLKSLALCKCLLLITVAITATCTSWLRKKHMLWCHKCCISQTTLIKGTLAQKSIQHRNVMCKKECSARADMLL